MGWLLLSQMDSLETVVKAPDVEDKNVKEEREVTVKKVKSYRKRKEKRDRQDPKVPEETSRSKTKRSSPEQYDAANSRADPRPGAFQTLSGRPPAPSTATGWAVCQT